MVDQEMIKSIGTWFQQEFEKSNACMTVEKDEWAQELACRHDSVGAKHVLNNSRE